VVAAGARALAVEPEDSAEVTGNTGRTGTVGTLKTAYVVSDAYLIGLPLMILAAWVKPLVVFALAAAGLIFVNIACCTWVDGHWDSWVAAGKGKEIEQRIEKLRSGRMMRRPVKWVRSGSDVWIALAAAVLNAVTVVALACVTGGKAIGAHRVLVASVAYSLFPLRRCECGARDATGWSGWATNARFAVAKASISLLLRVDVAGRTGSLADVCRASCRAAGARRG
jgi:hypothetical protein